MAVTLLENFRALFYAPFYAAFETGAFDRAGVEVILRTAERPGSGVQALVDGADFVAWGGPIRVFKDLDRDAESALVCFCEVVGRDPFQIVGRVPRPDFSVRDLPDCRFASFAEATTPWLCLQEDLRREGVDPAAVNRVADGPVADNIAALRAGDLDAIQVLEPDAQALIESGAAHLWYAGAGRGPCLYTTFYTRRAFVDEHLGELQAMRAAMAETLDWIYTEDAEKIAATVAAYFPAHDPGLLARALERYRAADLWNRTLAPSRTGFERLRAGLLSAGFITRASSYEEIIDARFV